MTRPNWCQCLGLGCLQENPWSDLVAGNVLMMPGCSVRRISRVVVGRSYQRADSKVINAIWSAAVVRTNSVVEVSKQEQALFVRDRLDSFLKFL
ncbi:hypothetical protein ElyMa_006799400 [Elysia marginata]|uniref:Uncharacterized protein n=1 Tax=Elysia marginata TaxID=1093978 RepID=A0AAV4J3K4_9GAST|nr:hypothetical protein ElyMa_006799400 [Elysia marginata]